MPEIVNEHVMGFVQNYVETKWPDASNEERQQEERDLELWAASENGICKGNGNPFRS